MAILALPFVLPILLYALIQTIRDIRREAFVMAIVGVVATTMLAYLLGLTLLDRGY